MDNNNDKIFYKTTNKQPLLHISQGPFGARLLSNTYKSGVGILLFDRPLTAIGDYAFSGCISLASVTIPDSVTSIGDGAFSGCISLASVTIPNSVTSIGDSAFYKCIALASVTIPDSVTRIGDGAFYNCGDLDSVTIPDSVTYIGGYAFYNCIGLTSVAIPNSVDSIGNYAFKNCSGLTSVTIGNSVTSIGRYAFARCSELFERLSQYKKYYKGFEPGLVCRDYHFKEGVVNELEDKEKEIVLCEHGFHFCDNILSPFDYYCGTDGKEMELWEVEPLGEIIHGDGHKHCCSELRLVRRIPFSEIGETIAEKCKE